MIFRPYCQIRPPSLAILFFFCLPVFIYSAFWIWPNGPTSYEIDSVFGLPSSEPAVVGAHSLSLILSRLFMWEPKFESMYLWNSFYQSKAPLPNFKLLCVSLLRLLKTPLDDVLKVGLTADECIDRVPCF